MGKFTCSKDNTANDKNPLELVSTDETTRAKILLRQDVRDNRTQAPRLRQRIRAPAPAALPQEHQDEIQADQHQSTQRRAPAAIASIVVETAPASITTPGVTGSPGITGSLGHVRKPKTTREEALTKLNLPTTAAEEQTAAAVAREPSRFQTPTPATEVEEKEEGKEGNVLDTLVFWQK